MTATDSSRTSLFEDLPNVGHHVVAQRMEPSTAELPPVPTYPCRRAPASHQYPFMDCDVWADAQWSATFDEISGQYATVGTRVAMLWDETNLYVGFRVDGPHRPPIATNEGDHVYATDDSVELFIHGDGHYYEIGRNSDNIGYEVRWVWLEDVVRRQDYEALEGWITSRDFIYYRRRSGEPIGRIGDVNYTLPGLFTRTSVERSSEGVISSWFAELTLPWNSLRSAVSGVWPPPIGESRRIMGYRIHHGAKEDRIDPPEQQTWSVMGNEDIHNPERWTAVTFVDCLP